LKLKKYYFKEFNFNLKRILIIILLMIFND